MATVPRGGKRVAVGSRAVKGPGVSALEPDPKASRRVAPKRPTDRRESRSNTGANCGASRRIWARARDQCRCSRRRRCEGSRRRQHPESLHTRAPSRKVLANSAALATTSAKPPTSEALDVAPPRPASALQRFRATSQIWRKSYSYNSRGQLRCRITMTADPVMPASR